MNLREQFNSALPEAFFLDASDLGGIGRYLESRGWLEPGESVEAAARAGEGNMNYTLRIRTSRRTFILKQARPWVEKYPQIAAPPDRALVEGRFYGAVSGCREVASRMPALMGLDESSRVIMLEDLGEARDCTSLYGGDRLTVDELGQLASYLSSLHEKFLNCDIRPLLANREMRALNHEHIFSIPLVRENGLRLDEITPGLSVAAGELKGNEAYVARVAELGRIYLADGPALLHGDFFPGSWLRTARGLAVIDPEFCFFGPPEFDIGVMVAHLHLSGQPEDYHEMLPGMLPGMLPDMIAGCGRLDRSLLAGFAGTEIMRRMIGVAQLPVEYGMGRKRELLDLSVRLVLEPDQLSEIGI